VTWLARLALLAIAAGCGDDAGRGDAGPSGCLADECFPFACDPGGGCFRSCRQDGECAADHQCQDRTCVGTECTPETALEVCGPYACLSGDCAADCALGPCADGYYCRGNDNECVPYCTSPGDPGCGGFLCNVEFGECEAYCDQQQPCAAGHVCDRDSLCREDLSAPACSAGCAPYACLEHLGRCAAHCLEPADCAGGATCVDQVCEP
jgi:hypothetical protein